MMKSTTTRVFRALLGAALVSGLMFALTPAPTSAGTVVNFNGYVCRVYTYNSGSYLASLYTGPGCSGSYIDEVQVRSTFWGGTAENYARMVAPLVSAAANDTRVTGSYEITSFFGFDIELFNTIVFNAN